MCQGKMQHLEVKLHVRGAAGTESGSSEVEPLLCRDAVVCSAVFRVSRGSPKGNGGLV